MVVFHSVGTGNRVRLLILLLSFWGSVSWAGSEGPCPITETPSPWVIQKIFHPLQSEVKELQLFDEAALIAVQSRNGLFGVLPLDAGGCHLTADGFATFSDPLTFYSLKSLQAFSVPNWHQPTQTVIREPRRYVAANSDGNVNSRRFELLEITHADAGVTPELLCQTPRIKGLEVTWGSQSTDAYFHSVLTQPDRSVVSVYHLNLQTCLWRTERRFVIPRIANGKVEAFRFQSGSVLLNTTEGVIWSTATRVEQFLLKTDSLVGLDPRFEAVLIRSDRSDGDALKLFVPSLKKVSTILRGVQRLNAKHVAYSWLRNSLLVSAAVQQIPSAGLYEFELVSTWPQ